MKESIKVWFYIIMEKEIAIFKTDSEMKNVEIIFENETVRCREA